MTDLFTRIWLGDLDLPSKSTNVEIEHLWSLIQSNISKLQVDSTEEERVTLQKIVDCFEEYSFESREAAFCEGVAFGIRLAAEAFLSDL